MNYLAIDTSGNHLTVVLSANGKIYEKFFPNSGVNHSVELMGAVDELFTKSNITPNDVDVFCSVVGPGSFTGIRIGVSTMKGFADPTNKKVLGVTSFDTIAYNKTCDKVLAVINARHDNFYVCGYENGAIVLEPNFVDLEKVKELSKEYKLLSYEPIDGLIVEIVSPLEGLKMAIEKNIDKANSNVNSVKPFYLRLSQAEEGRL